MSLRSVILEHHSAIVARWTEQAQRAASAHGIDRPAFLNILPTFVASLAEAGEELGEFTGRRRDLLERHVGTRLRQGFVLPEILNEIALIGQAVAHVSETLPENERPSTKEWAGIAGELQTAAITLAEVFRRHMLDDEQTEKRYRKLIESIGAEALRPGHESFRQRLCEVLGLILQAMGAQTAALLLFDTSERLRRTVTVGAAREEVEQLTSATDLRSFVGQVASREETTEILDVATTELEVSETLRRSGIHSLLGVRLPPRHALIGVLYIGIAEKRPFTQREVRRLEALGEQLTAQLDNAELFANLVDTIEALKRERALNERIVSLIAHDLRGPLTSLKLRVHGLLRVPDSQDARHDLVAKIAANIDQMDRMIVDLLDAHRVRAGGRLSLRIEQLDLASLARNVVDELRVVHGERFVLRAEEGLVGFWSADELRRALWNLATNAVKYGASDNAVTLAVRRIKGGVAMSVQNAGEPIPVADQERVFDAFARVGDLVQGRSAGWGLGLTLVKGCAEAHGGRVSLESTGETGTTFTIELPFDARPFQSTKAPAP